MNPRSHQVNAISQALNYIDNKPLICLPTGAGKSIVVREIARNVKNDIIVLQPNKVILEQNYAKYKTYSNDCAIFSASCNIKEIDRVTFATIGSVINNKKLFSNCKTIIIDECHLVDAKEKEGMYFNFINSLKSNIIGLTATPYRMHTTRDFGSQTKMITRTRPKVFNFIAHNTNPKELIDNGFLCKMKYFYVKILDKNALKLNMNKSDFTISSMQDMIKGKGIDISNFIQDISQKHKSVLIFSPSIEFSNKIKEYLIYKGLQCATIDSKMTQHEREEVLIKFKNKTFQIMINVGVLTTGFDFPELDCIVFLRPTLSISLYYQMVGRGLRTANNKEHCTIYDLCGNVDRFGKIEDFTIEGQQGKENLFSRINGLKVQLTHINKCF